MTDRTTSSNKNTMDCVRVMEQEIAERYVLGTLDEAEREAYEEHYFDCDRCFEELNAYRLIQEELARSEESAKPLDIGAWGASVRRWGWTAAAAASVLIAVGVWLRQPGLPPLPPPPVAVTPSPTPTPAPAATLPSLEELAAVRPPVYRPLTLRGPEDESRRRFRSAMEHYRKQEFGAAIPGLESAARLDPDAPDAHFFLGACYLLTGRTDRAVERLSRTIALGDSPYLEEAHFYLAKARLRQRDLAGAQAELQKTIRLKGDREREAQDLLAQIQTLPR